MKYIRTKDGIYTLLTQDNPIYELHGKKYYCVEERISSFSEDEIIKQANTIEELFDKYVVEFNHGKDKPLLHRDFDTLDEVYRFLNENLGRFILVSIKGAIWTDKGLIYVAEMNEKGSWTCYDRKRI